MSAESQLVRLDNFLSAEECKTLIALLSTKLPTDDHRKSDKRQRLQVDVVEQHIIDMIWGRLCEACEQSQRADEMLKSLKVDDGNDGLDGVWTASRLRPRLLFAGYRPGDFFGAHYDLRVDAEGNGAPSAAAARGAVEEVSHVTVVIYLNENGKDFHGGHTNVLEEGLREKKIIESVAPATGTALLFLQEEVYHEGGSVESGTKFILRADVMYKRAERQ
jgi:hypothetical protein